MFLARISTFGVLFVRYFRYWVFVIRDFLLPLWVVIIVSLILYGLQTLVSLFSRDHFVGGVGDLSFGPFWLWALVS